MPLRKWQEVQNLLHEIREDSMPEMKTGARLPLFQKSAGPVK
jgi:hypothetical protein